MGVVLAGIIMILVYCLAGIVISILLYPDEVPYLNNIKDKIVNIFVDKW